MLGRNVSILMPSPHHEQHDGYLERYLRTGDARIIGIGREVPGRRRDGTVFPVQLSVGEMHIAGERKFTGMLRDLTKRVHLEGELGASEARWRSIVDSAVDGIIVIDAHGHVEAFNQAAERLFGYAAQEVLGRNVHMLMPSPYHEEHDTYMTRYLATGRAKIIGVGREVQGRRKDGTTFSLHLSVGEVSIPPKLRRSSIELRTLVTTTAGLLSQDPSLKDVDVEINGAAPEVMADPEMLRIVFQNLLINSAHAMQGKGRIQIAVEAVDAATCQIAFIDSGPGIPADVRERIFTPFFTTKSRGSGLGLPTAKRLIEAHNGQIAVVCPPAGGTQVVIRLPIGAA